MIAIRNQSTRHAKMLSHGERLADFCPTNTSLRCTARVNFHKHTSGTFSLVRKHEEESCPPSIVNTFGEHSARQSFNVQVFDSNQPVVVDNLPRFFVMKVTSLVADVIVPTLKQKARLAPSVRTFLSSAHAPLQATKFGLSLAEPARILNHGAVTHCGERGQSHVDTDHVGIKSQRFRFTFNREDGKPSARFTFYQESFDYPFQRAMQLNLDVPDPGEPELVTLEGVTNQSKRDAVITTYGSETRVACPLASLDAQEERAERQVNALQNVFKNGGMDGRNVFSSLFNLRQLQYLVKERDRFSLDVPSVTPLLQSGVVKLGANSKRALQRYDLAFCWIDPIPERLNH